MTESNGYLDMEINGVDYSIVQISPLLAEAKKKPELADKWYWSTANDEGGPFESALETQQDALTDAAKSEIKFNMKEVLYG